MEINLWLYKYPCLHWIVSFTNWIYKWFVGIIFFIFLNILYCTFFAIFRKDTKHSFCWQFSCFFLCFFGQCGCALCSKTQIHPPNCQYFWMAVFFFKNPWSLLIHVLRNSAKFVFVRFKFKKKQQTKKMGKLKVRQN